MEDKNNNFDETENNVIDIDDDNEGQETVVDNIIDGDEADEYNIVLDEIEEENVVVREENYAPKNVRYRKSSKTAFQVLSAALARKLETTSRERKGAALICFCLVLIFSVYVLNEYHVINIGMGKGSLMSQVDFDNTKLETFEECENGFLCVKPNKVTFYGINGKETSSNEIKAADPFAVSNGKYTLVGARGENDVYVFENTKLLHTITTQNTIINANISSNGKVAIITTEPGYKTLLNVFDSRGESVYKWHSSGAYAIDVDFSPDSKRVACAVINDNATVVSGGVAILDLNREEPEAVVFDEDTLALRVCYAEDNRIMLACDNKLIWYNNKGTALYRATYYDRTLQKIEFTDDAHAVIGLSANIGGTVGAEGLIMVYNAQGKEICGKRIDNSIDMLDVSNGYFAVNSGNNVDVYSLNGKLVSTVVPRRDVMDIVMIDDGEKLMLASNTSADIYEW